MDYNKAFNYGTMLPPSNNIYGPRYDITVGGKVTGDTIPAILIVDSSQRNRSIYENPGHYVFTLPKTYRDVISIELIQANVPNSAYAINNQNNVLTFTFNDSDSPNGTLTYSSTLIIGNYDLNTLATELASSLNSPFSDRTEPDQQFAVSYSAVTQRFTITAPTLRTDGATTQSNNNFTIIAGVAYGADTIIGLGATTASSTNGSLTLPYSATVRPDRYIILDIRGLERCDGNSSALMGCFCALSVDCSSGQGDFTLKDGDNVDNDVYIYYFPEPLPKLQTLSITFKNTNGCIYEFNGRDHFLVFEIKCLSRPPKYSI